MIRGKNFFTMHPIHHRKHYRQWMLRFGVVLPWVTGFAVMLLPAIGTTSIINGKCYPTIALTPTSKKVGSC